MTDAVDASGNPVSGPWDDFKSPSHIERGPWDDYKPKQADPNAPGLLESFARGAAHGATFGYEDKLGLSKEANDASAQANPWTHFAGEIAGGFVPVAAATALAPEVAIPAGLARAAPFLKTAYTAARTPFVAGEIGTAGQAIKQGAKLGLSYGALAGSGNADVKDTDTTSQAMEKRLEGALGGAGQGLVLGPALGLVGHGIYRGAQGLGAAKAAAQAETEGMGAGALTTATRKLQEDRITPQALIDQIRGEFPDDTATAGGLSKRFWGNATGGNKQPITADQVEDTVRRAMAGESAADISAALSPGGKGTGPGEGAVKSLLDELATRHLGPLNIVDRAGLARTGSGDNTQMTMRAAAATPGEHVGIARENLLERQIGAGGRMSDLFGRTIGNPDFEAVTAQHNEALKAAGQRAYTTAFANEKPFDLQPIVNRWMTQYDNKIGPVNEGVSSALTRVLNKVPMRDPDTGAPFMNQLQAPQDLQGFIDARQNLKQIIDTTELGTPLHGKLSQLYKELTGEVARTNPEWATANNIWRDGMAGKEALEAGSAMSTKVNSASRENLSYYTDAQAEAAKAQKDLQAAKKVLSGSAASDIGVARPTPNAERVSIAPVDADQTITTSWGAKLQAKAGRDVIVERSPQDRWVVRKDIADKVYEHGQDGLYAKRADLAFPYTTAKRDQIIKTLEGPVKASKGDRIMTGTAGEKWPVKPEDFSRKYSTEAADQSPLQAAVEAAQARLDAANSRQELFRVGLVRALHDQVINNSGETYNLTRQLLLPGAQKMFRKVLGDKQADQFLKALKAEAAMHRTYGSQFGSQTTPLREAIDELNWAPKFDASLMNPMHWPAKALDLAHQYAARTISAARNKDLMGLYTEQDPLKQLDILRAMQAVHVRGSNAGNLFGKPVVSGAAPAVDAVISDQAQLNRPRVMEPYQP